MNIHFPAAVGLIVAACATVTLSGCSGAASFPDSPSGPHIVADTGGTLHGIAHGGQQPIVGARIYLLAAGTAGYGSAASSLLTAASYANYPTKKDANGWFYTTTDVSGSFQIMDACTGTQQVYVAAIGGDPGAGVNSASNEIALLGQCPPAGNFDGVLTGVYVSEISTVAAAYATAAYARDAFHIGSSNTTLGQVGIANAFSNAANLFNIQNNNDLAPVNTLDGIGIVPQAEVHTIANVLASCVNSVGPGSPSCTTLFTNAPANASGGALPTDVTMAAINIAHNPWANVTALYKLQTPSTPFAPQLKNVPADFSLSLSFPDGVLAKNGSLAVDAQGDVWTVAPNMAAVAEVSPTGKLLSPGAGFQINGGFANARSLAFDAGGNLWILGQGTFGIFNAPAATFAELDGNGIYLRILNDAGLVPLITEPPAAVTNLAIDGSGAMYFGGVRTVDLYGGQSSICCTVKFVPKTLTTTDLNPGQVTPGTNFVAVTGTMEWATSGTATLNQTIGSASTNMTGAGLKAAMGVALDHAGNAWVANSGGNSLSEFSAAGAALSGTSGFTGGGLATPSAIAIDGVGNVWSTNATNGSVSEFTAIGAPVGNGFAGTGLTNPGALAIDPSGNLWVTDAATAALTEYVGLAAPVVTPLASAVSTNALGTEP